MSTWDPHPERDLEHLARWLPLIEGRALVPARRREHATAHRDGRADGVDERPQEMRRALATLDRMRAVAAAHDGETHVRVLGYCYLWLGTDARVQFGRQYGGLDAHLGLVLATHKERLAWMLHPAWSMGLTAAGNAGRSKRVAAEQLYLHITCEDPRAEIDLGALRDELARSVESANDDITAMKRTREQNRVRR